MASKEFSPLANEVDLLVGYLTGQLSKEEVLTNAHRMEIEIQSSQLVEVKRSVDGAVTLNRLLGIDK